MPIFSSRQYKLIMLFLIVFCAGIIPACGPSKAQLDAIATANARDTATSIQATIDAAIVQTAMAQATMDVAVAQTVGAQTGSTDPKDDATPTSSTTGDTTTNETNVSDAPTIESVPVNAEIPQLSVPAAINVRSGPGTVYKVIGTLPTGAIVNIIAKDKRGDWFNIQIPNGSPTTGWVAGSVTDPVSVPAMATVQVAATIPPLPTSTPTATATATSVATQTATATATHDSSHTVTPTATHDSNHTATPTATQSSHTPTPTPTATSASSLLATLIVTNYGTDDICMLFISPSSASDWGNNKLDSPMGNTTTKSLDIDAGMYDLQAVNCSDAVVKDERDVSISAVYYWDIP